MINNCWEELKIFDFPAPRDLQNIAERFTNLCRIFSKQEYSYTGPRTSTYKQKQVRYIRDCLTAQVTALLFVLSAVAFINVTSLSMLPPQFSTFPRTSSFLCISTLLALPPFFAFLRSSHLLLSFHLLLSLHLLLSFHFLLFLHLLSSFHLLLLS
jgi:hypothetical protein